MIKLYFLVFHAWKIFLL